MGRLAEGGKADLLLRRGYAGIQISLERLCTKVESEEGKTEDSRETYLHRPARSQEYVQRIQILECKTLAGKTVQFGSMVALRPRQDGFGILGIKPSCNSSQEPRVG